MRRVRFWLKALAAGAWLLLACVLGFFLALVRWRNVSNGHFFARLASRGVLPLLGMRLRVLGEEHLLPSQPCIYVANHQSVLDVPILGRVYPTRTIVTGKKELLWVPFFGIMFFAMGNLLIDRSRKRNALSALRRVAEKMRDERLSVWVFPEGHRNPERPMLPFQKGAFHMALLAGVPIVPIVCGNYGALIDPARKRVRSGVVEIRVLEPLPTAGLGRDGLETLMRVTRERMDEALAQADEGTRPDHE